MKNIQKTKQQKHILRQNRTRRKILLEKRLPRLSVFRSLKHFYMQVVDDKRGITVCAASDKDVKAVGKPALIAAAVGKEIAKRALDKGVKAVVFDRGRYLYHGRVQAAAEAARAAGLKF